MECNSKGPLIFLYVKSFVYKIISTIGYWCSKFILLTYKMESFRSIILREIGRLPKKFLVPRMCASEYWPIRTCVKLKIIVNKRVTTIIRILNQRLYERYQKYKVYTPVIEIKKTDINHNLEIFWARVSKFYTDSSWFLQTDLQRIIYITFLWPNLFQLVQKTLCTRVSERYNV